MAFITLDSIKEQALKQTVLIEIYLLGPLASCRLYFKVNSLRYCAGGTPAVRGLMRLKINICK